MKLWCSKDTLYPCFRVVCSESSRLICSTYVLLRAENLAKISPLYYSVAMVSRREPANLTFVTRVDVYQLFLPNSQVIGAFVWLIPRTPVEFREILLVQRKHESLKPKIFADFSVKFFTLSLAKASVICMFTSLLAVHSTMQLVLRLPSSAELKCLRYIVSCIQI